MRILLGFPGGEIDSSYLADLRSQHEVICVPADISNDCFGADHAMTDHIAQARWADEIRIVNPTAEWITRAAQGSGADFLLLQLLATKAPVSISCSLAPALWNQSTVQASVEALRARGVAIANR